MASSSHLLRWAAGGWAFFIAENAILSENRTWIINEIGDEEYHLLYGTFSTMATGSIGYAYYKLKKDTSAARLFKGAIPLPNKFGAWIFLSMGLVMASQALPKAQIPVAIQNNKVQVRCPFDFSDKHEAGSVRGMERISRHPGLWSLGFVGLANSLLQSTLPMRVWWLGPASIAWLGGAHNDSRFRRGMGGTLDPGYESQTSNIPFAAMITGKQGNLARNLNSLLGEIKPLNALLAIGAATLFVLSRGKAKL